MSTSLPPKLADGRHNLYVSHPRRSDRVEQETVSLALPCQVAWGDEEGILN